MESPLRSRSFALVVASAFGVFTSFGLLIYALPLYTHDVLGSNNAGVGLAVGAASVGAILAGPTSGRLGDRLGRRPILFASAFVMVAGYLVLALEPPFAVIVPVRLVAGGAEAAFVVATYSMAIDLAPESRQGEAASLATVGSYAGLAVGPALGVLVLGDDRFALLWVVAAALVGVSALCAAFVPETRPDHEEGGAGWLPPRTAVMPGFVLLLALLGFGGFNAFVVLYARDIGVAQPGFVFALFGAVVIAVRVFGRQLPDRLGSRLTASIACGAIVTGLVIIAAWESPAGLYLGTAVFGCGQALAYPSLVLLAMGRTPPSERSAAVGTVAAFVDVALATGALVLGVAADAWDYRAVFLVSALSAVVGFVLLQRVGQTAATASPLP